MKIFLKILLWLILISVVLFLLYKYIGQPQQIFGDSMSPSLPNHTYVLSSKITYLFRPPQRGDIVTLHFSSGYYIMRIIGLPGDKIQLIDGNIILNGSQLTEPYVSPGTKTFPNDTGFPLPDNFTTGIVVPENHFFMLSDFPEKTTDSRGLGFIPRDSIYTVVIAKL